jgi:hypothetical protein
MISTALIIGPVFFVPESHKCLQPFSKIYNNTLLRLDINPRQATISYYIITLGEPSLIRLSMDDHKNTFQAPNICIKFHFIALLAQILYNLYTYRFFA